MAGLLKAFNSALIRKPLATQCITSAVLFGSGDVLAQQAFEKKGANHDWMRTGRIMVYGGALFGPVVTKWLQFLNRLHFASPARGVAYKVALDQGVATPAIVAFFFGSMTLLEGKGISEAKERISDAYVPTLIRNWGVFIPTQVVNFAIVPHHMRFITVGVVSLFWNAYLSSVNAKTQAEEAAAHSLETKRQAVDKLA